MTVEKQQTEQRQTNEIEFWKYGNTMLQVASNIHVAQSKLSYS